MTGWGLAAVLVTMAGICAFVSYWWGRGHGERAAIGEVFDQRAEIIRLRQIIISNTIDAQRREANSREGAILTAAQIDEWFELTAELDDLDGAA